jgi:dTDP-4-dehydrorhamnose 3,5-epimerase
MPIRVEKTDLDGVLAIDPPTRFEDFRGEYVEMYDEETYRQAGIPHHFVQDDISVSRRHVLRGLHGDQTTWKLVSCLLGALYLVVVDWRPDSPRRGHWVAFTLSAANRRQVLVPPNFGNGHLVLTETAIFHYKQSTSYDGGKGQFTLYWDDPALNIHWPIANPILSARDSGRPAR